MATQRIYLDNAATTPLDKEVISVMTGSMETLFGNPSSIHHEGRQSKTLVERARKTVAGIFHVSPGEIYFTSGGTESNNTAIKGSVKYLGVRRIITSRLEHHCVSHSIASLDPVYGVQCIYLDNDAEGHIDQGQLKSLLAASDKPTLVTLMHANNEIGTVLDIRAVGELCKEYGAYFHSDTVQTVGHLPIDLSNTYIHFISGSAHKIHGPKGAGMLYINHEIMIKAFIDGGSQERNMRGGTENVYGIAGFATALELASRHMEKRSTYIRNLKNHFINSLKKAIPDVEFNGDISDTSLYTVLNVSFPPNERNDMLLMNLDIYGISASGGSACSSGSEERSEVIMALGKDSARKPVRFSFSHFNTMEEVDKVVGILKDIYS
jgi:cysteine desulfurase